jgi:dienelactone hydrolase
MNSGNAMALFSLLAAGWAAAEAPGGTLAVSGLSGVYRDGQVFLTWREAELPAGATLSVYAHREPISTGTLAQARCLAAQIDPHSARDWWQDPASFSRDATPGTPAGWVLRAGADPLDPAGGLFVHTVTEATAGPRHYAVTWTASDGTESREITPGANATAAPIDGSVALPLPVWQAPNGTLPAANSGAGRRLVLSLHGRGGGVTAGPTPSSVNCLWFGDATQGWREGLAFKFMLSLQPDTVVITPMDRVWIGRAVTESGDQRDHCPAINTWWFGYNENIRQTTHTDPVSAPNYTERYLLGLLRWAQRYLGCDPNATYVNGGSMGGSATVALALHFPDVFAAAQALVPVYSCTRPGQGSATRLECMCGPLTDKRTATVGGATILDYLNGTRNLLAASGDTPPIFATNGRKDGSIPWENNPPFYAAAEQARQAFAVYWNNGDHGMSGQAPADVKAWSSTLYRYRLDQSYPCFTACSDNRNYGKGTPTDGDLEGWINRGLTWEKLEDTADSYAITILADYPGIAYPVTLAVTPRRRQHFKPAPGTTLVVVSGDTEPRTLTVEPTGRFTITGVAVPGAAGTRLTVRRQ